MAFCSCQNLVIYAEPKLIFEESHMMWLLSLLPTPGVLTGAYSLTTFLSSQLRHGGVRHQLMESTLTALLTVAVSRAAVSQRAECLFFDVLLYLLFHSQSHSSGRFSCTWTHVSEVYPYAIRSVQGDCELYFQWKSANWTRFWREKNTPIGQSNNCGYAYRIKKNRICHILSPKSCPILSCG